MRFNGDYKKNKKKNEMIKKNKITDVLLALWVRFDSAELRSLAPSHRPQFFKYHRTYPIHFQNRLQKRKRFVLELISITRKYMRSRSTNLSLHFWLIC